MTRPGTRRDRPLWAEVQADLRTRLDGGDFDERFPTDRELMSHYGVSRHTVREAVRGLGQVERRPRVGGRIRPAAGVVEQLVSALRALGVRLELIDLQPAAPDRSSSHLLLADDQPLLVSRLWPAPGASIGTDELRAFLGLTARDTTLAPIEETVLPIVPDTGVHTALMLPTSMAVYRIDAGIERTRQAVGRHHAYVRPDRYRCAIRFDARIPT
ncbi:MAG: GntR family transcriptional regulator [Actinomycetota bacterium]|nr:GntR family transcriptional regulator [Actinomycetota bacterium]